jgi:putative ABC transport system permease protein
VSSPNCEDADHGRHEAIAELPEIVSVAPHRRRGQGEGGQRTVPTLLGTTPEFFDVRRFHLRSGRPSTSDDRAARRVVVLGARVADQLADPDIVGKQVRIRGIPFDVIGVLAPKAYWPTATRTIKSSFRHAPHSDVCSTSPG